jgi:excisionase family DNA binding protein
VTATAASTCPAAVLPRIDIVDRTARKAAGHFAALGPLSHSRLSSTSQLETEANATWPVFARCQLMRPRRVGLPSPSVHVEGNAGGNPPVIERKLARCCYSPPPERRGLSRGEAAEYIGVGVSKFDALVADKRMPAPKRIDGRRVWDRRQVDRAFDCLDGGAGVGANPWDA